jgi:hypothetical protein
MSKATGVVLLESFGLSVQEVRTAASNAKIKVNFFTNIVVLVKQTLSF